MAFLEIAGQRHPVPPGEAVIGSDPSAAVTLEGAGVAPCHALLQTGTDGQVVVRRFDENVEVLINGVRLGPQPTPLLHGDKIEIAGHELLFIDERRSGRTEYVQAVNPALFAAAARKPGAPRAPTVASGGRLVSLTDGREYTIIGASLVIGRDAGCDVVVISKAVSRRHSEIKVTPQGYLLVDSSINGTFVNGQKIKRQQLLARADVIRVGDNEFRFYADLAMQPEPPAPAPGAASRLADTLIGVPGVPRPSVPPAEPRTGEGAAAVTPTPPVPSWPPAAAPPAPSEAPPPPAAAPPPPPSVAAPPPPSVAAPPPPSMAPPPPPPPPPPPRPPVAAPPAPAVPPPAARPVAGPLAFLVVRSGRLKGHRLPIRVPVVNVGRADYNDLVLPDDSVSTVHAKFQRREGIWIVVDLDSTNGTYVDGERVADEVPLAPGALVRFGEVRSFFEPADQDELTKGGSTKLISAIRLPPEQ